MAACGAWYRPASEKESGVTLRMAITGHRSARGRDGPGREAVADRAVPVALPTVTAGRLRRRGRERVRQEHGDGHRADASGYRGDQPGGLSG